MASLTQGTALTVQAKLRQSYGIYELPTYRPIGVYPLQSNNQAIDYLRCRSTLLEMKTTTAVILALASSAVAQWGQSCVNETINAADDVLSARCNVGDGKGTFANTTLDLNTCFRYADGKIMVSGKIASLLKPACLVNSC